MKSVLLYVTKGLLYNLILHYWVPPETCIHAYKIFTSRYLCYF